MAINYLLRFRIVFSLNTNTAEKGNEHRRHDNSRIRKTYETFKKRSRKLKCSRGKGINQKCDALRTKGDEKNNNVFFFSKYAFAPLSKIYASYWGFVFFQYARFDFGIRYSLRRWIVYVCAFRWRMRSIFINFTIVIHAIFIGSWRFSKYTSVFCMRMNKKWFLVKGIVRKWKFHMRL